jgi:hypothetical protein
MGVGIIKTHDEIRILSNFGPYLVAGGKGT